MTLGGDTPRNQETPIDVMTKTISWLLFGIVGYLPLAADASFQDWYGLLTGSWTNPSFPAEIPTTFSYKNLACSQIKVTLDGEELARSSVGQDNEQLWAGPGPLIKQTWPSDRHLRVTVWLMSDADAIDSVMAFSRGNEIRLYYSQHVNKWEGPGPPIACIFTHRLTYDFQNIDRKQYDVKLNLWIWELFYVKVTLVLALVLLGWYLYRWTKKQRSQ